VWCSDRANLCVTLFVSNNLATKNFGGRQPVTQFLFTFRLPAVLATDRKNIRVPF
jgi:hypothetical protein